MTTAVRASRPVPRPIILVLAAFLAASGAMLANASPVAACSCAPFQTMKSYATGDNAVFTGTAGERDARGVPVQVDRWFWGRAAAPVVWLAAASFGDGASCGTNPPPAGSAWIWVTWLPPDQGDPMTGLCSPSGDLTSPEGQKLLAEASQVFPDLGPQLTPEPSVAPAIQRTPTPTSAPDPAAVARDNAGLTIGAALVALTIALFGGVALVARRSNRRTDDH